MFFICMHIVIPPSCVCVHRSGVCDSYVLGCVCMLLKVSLYECLDVTEYAHKCIYVHVFVLYVCKV